MIPLIAGFMAVFIVALWWQLRDRLHEILSEHEELAKWNDDVAKYLTEIAAEANFISQQVVATRTDISQLPDLVQPDELLEVEGSPVVSASTTMDVSQALRGLLPTPEAQPFDWPTGQTPAVGEVAGSTIAELFAEALEEATLQERLAWDYAGETADQGFRAIDRVDVVVRDEVLTIGAVSLLLPNLTLAEHIMDSLLAAEGVNVDVAFGDVRG